MEIIREPNKDELYGDINDDTSKAFIPLQTPSGKVLSPLDKFNQTISKHQQEAMKKGLPFAEATVRADLKDIQDKLFKTWTRQGYVKEGEMPKIDWKKYSDLKNFEVIEEGYTRDAGLSKEHKVAVNVKTTLLTIEKFDRIKSMSVDKMLIKELKNKSKN